MRLFVAVDLPAALKDELDGVVASLRPRLPAAKWVPRDNLHLTVAFLGEVAEERVPAVATALREAAASVPAFVARPGGAGAFPSAGRARVLWTGLESDGDRLAVLAEAAIGALEPVGFPREKRPWSAHVTLARLRVPASVRELLPIDVPGAPFAVTELTLFRSRLARPAPRYEALERFPLAP